MGGLAASPLFVFVAARRSRAMVWRGMSWIVHCRKEFGVFASVDPRMGNLLFTNKLLASGAQCSVVDGPILECQQA